MIKKLLLTFILANILQAHINASRIINGQAATPGQIPWQAAIYGDGRLFCGGALINHQWVITAAHCAYEITTFDVTLGTVLLNEGSNITSELAHVHSGYSPFHLGPQHDVAVIKLSVFVNFTDFIQAIALPTKPLLASSNVTVSGWGYIHDETTDLIPVLNYVNLTIITNEDCQSRFDYFDIIDGIGCAITPEPNVGNKGTCNGDSGGAYVLDAFTNPVHVGIVSFGEPYNCEKGYPDGFTRTEYYLNWITDAIN